MIILKSNLMMIKTFDNIDNIVNPTVNFYFVKKS